MCEQGKFVCDDGSPIMGHDLEAKKDVLMSSSFSCPPMTSTSAIGTDMLVLPADGSCDSLPA